MAKGGTVWPLVREKARSGRARAKKESNLRPWRILHARAAFCTNQSCVRTTRGMVFTQPRPTADLGSRVVRGLAHRIDHARPGCSSWSDILVSRQRNLAPPTNGVSRLE